MKGEEGMWMGRMREEEKEERDGLERERGGW